MRFVYEVVALVFALGAYIFIAVQNGMNSLNLQYSFEDSENIPVQFIRHKMHKNKS